MRMTLRPSVHLSVRVPSGVRSFPDLSNVNAGYISVDVCVCVYSILNNLSHFYCFLYFLVHYNQLNAVQTRTTSICLNTCVTL